MLKKCQRQVRSRCGTTSREKGKSEGDYITYDGVDVTDMTEIKMFHPTYTYIKRPFVILMLFLSW